MKLFAITLSLFPLIACASMDVDKKPYPEAGRGGARYEVPTTDDDLKPFATYPIKDIHTTESADGVVTIAYTLPLELTGAENKIVLSSTDKTTNGAYTNFKGPNGEANCDAQACNVRYKNVDSDLGLVKSLLISQGVGGLELGKRIEIARQFSGDPAGIIHFDQSVLK